MAPDDEEARRRTMGEAEEDTARLAVDTALPEVADTVLREAGMDRGEASAVDRLPLAGMEEAEVEVDMVRRPE